MPPDFTLYGETEKQSKQMKQTQRTKSKLCIAFPGRGEGGKWMKQVKRIGRYRLSVISKSWGCKCDSIRNIGRAVITLVTDGY